MTTYTYDDADRLTGIDSRTSVNAVIATYDYTLDNNGNRVSIDKNIPAAGTLPARNETATYSHNRLMSTDTALYNYDNEGQLSQVGWVEERNPTNDCLRPFSSITNSVTR